MRETHFHTGRRRGLVDRAPTARVPAGFIARGEDQLRVWVGGEEFRDEGAGGEVADCLAISEELVPVCFFEGAALGAVFGEEGGVPEVDVEGVFEEVVHVVGVFEAELFEGDADCCGKRKGD